MLHSLSQCVVNVPGENGLLPRVASTKDTRGKPNLRKHQSSREYFTYDYFNCYSHSTVFRR